MKPKDFVGGRGKKVTYQTEMFRIPTPLRPTIQQIGLQFRFMWDGLTDPKGENLISRLNLAIPDVEQPAASGENNQISGKRQILKPDSKYKEEAEDEDEDADEIEPDEPDQDNERTIRDQAASIQKHLTNIRMLEREAVAAKEELKELRSGVEDLESDRDGWQASACQWQEVVEHERDLLDTAKKELTEVRSQLSECQQDGKRDAVDKRRLEEDVIALQVTIADMREQTRNQAAQVENRHEEVCQRFVSPDVITILQNAITPIKQGGIYEYNNASKLKKQVEQVLKLLISTTE